MPPSERRQDQIARVLSFLWPRAWLQTTRGIRVCFILTGGLAGAIICGTIAWLATR